jgi:putative hydrolase of the HAD superfamily
MAIRLVGFDGDDTLWRSEDYYRAAEAALEDVLGLHRSRRGRHAAAPAGGGAAQPQGVRLRRQGHDLVDDRSRHRADRRAHSAADIKRILDIGRATLEHPVVLLDGIREAVAAIAARHPVVLITKGDLFHQEAKIARSGLTDLFPRIEIVSEKDPATYTRVLAEFGVAPGEFAMIGNSLPSDVEPVVKLGGWGIHMPYHVTWAHELEHGLADDHAHAHRRRRERASGGACAHRGSGRLNPRTPAAAPAPRGVSGAPLQWRHDDVSRLRRLLRLSVAR